MAKLELTEAFSHLDGWSGALLEAKDDTVILTRTATSYSFQHGNNHDLPGSRITITGTGFTYINGQVTGGNITGIVMRDGSGAILATLTDFVAKSLPSDLPQVLQDIFGWTRANGDTHGGDGNNAWSHLLSGNDTILGTNGDDYQSLPGVNVGNDTYDLKNGDNASAGSIGNDRYIGGSGYDSLDFSETSFSQGMAAFRGIKANLVTGRVLDCWGGTDTISGFEEIQGSRFNDVFIGNDGRNNFSGYRGRDSFNGGGDQDQVRYDRDEGYGGNLGIVVDLEKSFANGHVKGTIRDGFGNLDRTTDIERVIGTLYNDSFTGSREDNVFSGGEGRDSFRGEGGFDRILFDRWFGDDDIGNISIDLRLASGQIKDDGFGNVETADGIEQFVGGFGNDTMIGNAGDHHFVGRSGADTLTGGGGNDTFEFWGQDDANAVDRITDFSADDSATNDRLGFYIPEFDGMTTTLNLVNGTSATQATAQFIYNANNDTLYFDRDGTGGAQALALVVLTGVDSLSAANFVFYE